MINPHCQPGTSEKYKPRGTVRPPMTDGDGTDDGALASFVRRTRRTLDAEAPLSAANTDLRVVLPLLKTLGWDVHSEVVADFEVRADADGAPGADAPDARPAPDDDGEDGDDATDGTNGGDAPSSVTVDYALTLDDRPSVFVVTAGTETPLSSDHGRRLGAAMNAARVDRGLVTNGRSFVFVAVGGDGTPDAADTDGPVQRTRCDLADLPDRPSLLSLYSRDSARARRQRRRAEDRRAVAEALRERRETAVEGVERALAADLESPVADELATAAEAVVDDAIDALATGDHPAEAVAATEPAADVAGVGAEAEAGDGETADGEPDHESAAGEDTRERTAPAESGDANVTDDHSGPTTAAGGRPAATAEATTTSSDGDGRDDGETDPRNEAAPMSRNDTEGEYVVRFFDEHSSVGAVGTATPGGAVAQAVSFLAERRALGNRLDFPWTPEDAAHLDPDTAVVNREPVHPDGRSMADPHRVESGYYVETDLSSAAAHEVIEQLGTRTGLRVMFQGAW